MNITLWIFLRFKLGKLRKELLDFTKDVKFKRARSMGQILKTALEFVKRNYEDVNMRTKIN